MTTNVSHKLRELLSRRALVRFSRRLEEFRVRGYVVAVGPKFFLLALVSDRIWFDGFECFRIADVRDLKPDPVAGFAEAALRKRGVRRPRTPRIDLESVEGMLLSAGRRFPLVTIHRERVDPDTCAIGRVIGVSNGRVLMREINPDATWDVEISRHRIAEITRVGFGADYEAALYLVGGEPDGT